jgi:hypothetical protein
MNIKQKELYEKLPNQFTSKQAKEICSSIGLNERYFEISLNRKEWKCMFKKVFHGVYLKT